MTHTTPRLRALLLAGAALAGLCPAFAALAQTSPAVSAPASLDQALVAAYYNNATLQQQRAVLRQTDENVPTALSGWRPTVTVQGTVGKSTGSERETTLGYNSLTGQNEDVKTTIPENGAEKTAVASLTQPIYTGGKVSSQTREAKNNVYAARAQLLSQEETVFLNVTQAYVSVVADQQLLALQRSNAQVLEQQVHDTQTQFNVGEITMTSVAQAQASLAQAREEVEVAKGNLRIARENFRELVGVYPADSLAPPQPLLLPVKDAASAGVEAVHNNPDVVAAQFQDAAAKDAVDVAFAALMPQLSAQIQAYNEDGSSGQQIYTRGASFTAQLTVPLYQGGQEYSAIRTAKAKAQETFAGILDAQRTAYGKATQAWAGLDSSRASILASNAEIKADAIALDGVEREELVGTRTTQDVLNQQQYLLNAQIQQVQNIAQMVNYSYAVAQAIGRLTAKDLGLPVQEYNDLEYYNAVKYAGFGTGGSADRKAHLAPDGTMLDVPQAPVIPATDPAAADAMAGDTDTQDAGPTGAGP